MCCLSGDDDCITAGCATNCPSGIIVCNMVECIVNAGQRVGVFASDIIQLSIVHAELPVIVLHD